jgi:hypothetical protein
MNTASKIISRSIFISYENWWQTNAFSSIMMTCMYVVILVLAFLIPGCTGIHDNIFQFTRARNDYWSFSTSGYVAFASNLAFILICRSFGLQHSLQLCNEAQFCVCLSERNQMPEVQINLPDYWDTRIIPWIIFGGCYDRFIENVEGFIYQ